MYAPEVQTPHGVTRHIIVMVASARGRLLLIHNGTILRALTVLLTSQAMRIPGETEKQVALLQKPK